MAKTYLKDITKENVTDWERTMFNSLSPEVLGKANVAFTTDKYGNLKKPEGVKAIGHYTPTGPGADADQVYSQTYIKDLGTVNGLHLYANYDEKGKLTGIDEGRALAASKPVTKVYSNESQYLRPSWDATGKPTPVTGKDTKSGGLFSDFFSDVTSGFDDLVLQNPALRSAALAYFAPVISSEISSATGVSPEIVKPVTNATLAAATGSTPENIAANYLAGNLLAPTSDVGTVNGPDNIDVGGGWSPATGATAAQLASARTSLDANAPDNIDAGGGWSPATPAANTVTTPTVATPDANTPDNIDAGGGWSPATGATSSELAAARAGLDTVTKPTTGTTLADILPYTAGAGVLTGLIQADAAKSGAEAQTDAAKAAINLQQKNFETINTQQAPYRAAGYNALNNLAGLTAGQTPQYDASGNIVRDANGNPVMISGSGYLQHQFNAADLKAGLAPNYDFMLQQGQMANQRAANMGGGALGGNALQGLNKYTQDYAGNAYQNAFTNYQNQRNNIYNTLAGIAGIGQTGQTATNTAATNATNAASNLGVGSAAATAAGNVGAANAITNAVNNVANNYTLASLLNQGGRVAP